MSTELDSALPAQKVLRQFRIVFNAVKTHFQQMERHTGYGGTQLWALYLVAKQPGMGVTELAKAMDIHQSTASNLVKALLGKGLLRSEKASHDRRAVLLFVTEEGDAVQRNVPGPHSGLLPQALAKLDDAALTRLNQDLGILIQMLGIHADDAAAHRPLADL